jgi:hypothetical protein
MKKKNQSYLVKFTYDYYCQGYEDTRETVLVHNCPSFEAACNRIRIVSTYLNARDFENLTIDI